MKQCDIVGVPSVHQKQSENNHKGSHLVCDYLFVLLPADAEGEELWLADRAPKPGLPVLLITLSACPLKYVPQLPRERLTAANPPPTLAAAAATCMHTLDLKLLCGRLDV